MQLILAILILPFIAAFIGYWIGKYNGRVRDVFNIVFTSVEFVLIVMLYQQVAIMPVELMLPDIMGTGIHLKVDTMRYAMLFVSSLIWLLTTLYSTQYLIKYKNQNRYYLFFMLTYATTVGFFMSENLLNLFTFFEGLSLTSYFLVIHDEDEYSHDAGRSYLGMAIAGGLITLFGIFLAFDYTKTLELSQIGYQMSQLGAERYAVAALIMIGFLIKASVFPLHTWLPKAHPAAPAPASAILSGILVKTGIFGLLIIIIDIFLYDLALSSVVLIFGMINVLVGGILALMQRNLKRILAYSSMSQLGFMLMGVGLIGILGEHGSIAMIGTLLYIVNHALLKVLLFLSAGIIYMVLGELSLNVIRGFGREKPLLKGIFLFGILGITGVPGFNGYISKTLLHEAILEAEHLTHHFIFTIAEWVFILGGAMTVAYMLKIFIAIFVEKNPAYHGQYKEHINKRALFPIGVLATLSIVIGLFPGTFITAFATYSGSYGMLVPEQFHYFSLSAFRDAGFTLTLGVIIYFYGIEKKLIVRDGGQVTYINPSLRWINIERDLFIPVLKITFHVSTFIFRVFDEILITLVALLTKTIRLISDMDHIVIPKFKMPYKRLHMPQISIQKLRRPVINPKIKLTLMDDAVEMAQGVKAESTKVKTVVSNKLSNITSLTSSIFMIGFVLIFSLLYVFLAK